MINKKYIYSLGGIIMAVAFTGCGAFANKVDTDDNEETSVKIPAEIFTLFQIISYRKLSYPQILTIYQHSRKRIQPIDCPAPYVHMTYHQKQ